MGVRKKRISYVMLRGSGTIPSPPPIFLVSLKFSFVSQFGFLSVFFFFFFFVSSLVRFFFCLFVTVAAFYPAF